MKWLTPDEQRAVKEVKSVFEAHYESIKLAYGETVTLKGLRDALQQIEARKVEAKVNAGRKSKSETQTPVH